MRCGYRLLLIIGNSIVLLSWITVTSSADQQWRPIHQRINEDNEFQLFKQLINRYRTVRLYLYYNELTIFLPEKQMNYLHNNSNNNYNDVLLSYHISPEIKTLKQLRTTRRLLTITDTLPLWITNTQNGIYVNNAKILIANSNYIANTARNQLGRNQVLHIIDEILDPSINVQLKASALDFLQQYHRWNLRAYETVEIFRKKVQQYGKTDSFRKPGGHTFLIPIDQKIDNYRRDNIDNDIIDGHIIPNQVLFLRPTEKQFIFETQATSDRMYIVVAFLEENRKYYIKCYTVFGNSHRKNSETVVEIVHGNIPVTNGVVHLIQQPLAVKEHELKPFPYLPVLYKITADLELNFTYQMGERCGINKLLDNDTVIFTYFVSKDRGWGKYFSYSMDDFYDVLGRHLIVSTQRYTINDLINLSSTTVNGTVLDTISGPVQLKFEEINGKFYVIWNQKKIRILRADYKCTNGIVHILESPFCHIEEIIFDYLTINNRSVLSTTTVKPNFWSMLKDLIA